MMKVVPPRCSEPGNLVMNPRCAYDVPLNERPPVSHSPPVSVWVMNASWRLQYTAPFGRPVVPEVKMIATGRSGSSASGGGAAPRTRNPWSTSRASSAGDTTTTLLPPGSSTPCETMIVTFGCASSSTAERSRTERRSLTPAVIAPSLAAAQ